MRKQAFGSTWPFQTPLADGSVGKNIFKSRNSGKCHRL
jgi:hypothetical protein